jgi:hypothetical protein
MSSTIYSWCVYPAPTLCGLLIKKRKSPKYIRIKPLSKTSDVLENHSSLLPCKSAEVVILWLCAKPLPQRMSIRYCSTPVGRTCYLKSSYFLLSYVSYILLVKHWNAEVFPQESWITFLFLATANSWQGRRLLLGDRRKCWFNRMCISVWK